MKKLLKTLSFYLIVFTLYRLFFLIGFLNELTSVGKSVLLKSLFMGLRFDLRLSLICLLVSFLIIRWRKIYLFATAMLLGLINFSYMLDVGHYSYLHSRVNASVISFLKNPLISLQMIRESYPLLALVIFFLLITTIEFFIYHKWLKHTEERSLTKKRKWIEGVAFFFFCSLGLYGSLQMYPLRWSEAFQSPDAFTSNLSLNPILYVIDTYSFRNTDYDEKEVKKYYPEVAKFLQVDHPDISTLNFLREFKGDEKRAQQHPNVVVIIMESMAYYKTGLGGSKVNPTPGLDHLKEESLLFKNFYTPTVATARSVFAAITSLPDISKVQTGTRNPFVVNQNTIMGQATQYEKFYFIGGSANWGNIRGVLSHNIPNLHIYEEGSYQSPRVDVWGLSDLDLFYEASAILNTSSKPFFAVIQSAGFHRPYTIPQKSINDGFKILTEKDLDPALVTRYGFESMSEYNAMRLQDYSLKKFFEKARQSPWYANTIFLVFGDHGLHHNNAPNVPEWSKFNANGYHVPFLIHSPKYIQKGVNEKIASEMDVMPTIAGLIGIPYKIKSLGRDLFNPKYDESRAAFSYNWYAPHHLTLIDASYYFEYIPYNGNAQLIKYDVLDNTENLREKEPSLYLEREKLTKGLYETSKYLLYHNTKTY